MEFTIKAITVSGVEEYLLDSDKIGILETECLKHYDKRISDLICMFLDEECTEHGIYSQEKLFESELRQNLSGMYEYSATPEYGAQLTLEQIKHRFRKITDDYSVMLDAVNLIDYPGFVDHYNKITDPDELLFWAFRYCAWGQYDNKLPYTLFRCIVDGRFKRFYDSHPEWQSYFIHSDCPECLPIGSEDTANRPLREDSAE